MLKSDSWIERQCTPPKFVVTERIWTMPKVGMSSLDLRSQDIERFSSQSEEDLHALQRQHALTNEPGLPVSGVIGYRPVEAEDLQNWRPMISPYVAGQVRETPGHLSSFNPDEPQREWQFGDPMESYRIPGKKIVSYGTSSYGYDVRLGTKFKIFTNVFNGMIDPLKADPKIFVDHEGDTCVIPPNSYILGHTIETFVMPRNVTAICLGKSTYARCGAIVNVTPIEAGFEGQVVIEISNATPLPMVVHANQGIAQFLFFESDEACKTSYADRAGKYQGQQGLQTALV